MKAPADDQEKLRPHSYDGIQEYDQRLPNWWLFTLYGAIVFAFAYWFFYFQLQFGTSPGTAVELQLMENKEAANRGHGTMTNDLLWTMSRDQASVAAGQAAFQANCASCHLATLTGLIGPNLVDEYWIHGGTPLEVVSTITNGVPAKGMPTWGPVLGNQKINEVTAFILSHHRQGEPIRQAPPWVPGQPMQVPTQTAGN